MRPACNFCHKKKIKCLQSLEDPLSCRECLDRGLECIQQEKAAAACFRCAQKHVKCVRSLADPSACSECLARNLECSYSLPPLLRCSLYAVAGTKCEYPGGTAPCQECIDAQEEIGIPHACKPPTVMGKEGQAGQEEPMTGGAEHT